MSYTIYEGVVENGQVRLPPGLVLPEGTKVYVEVPQAAASEPIVINLPDLRLRKQPIRIPTVHIANREQADDFLKKIYMEGDDSIAMRNKAETSW